MGRLFVMVLLILSLVTPVVAESLTTLQKQQQQISLKLKQTRKRSLELKRKERSARGVLGQTKQKLVVTDNRLTVTQKNLHQANQKLLGLQDQLLRLERKRETQRLAMIQRLRFKQRHSLQQQWWTILLSSDQVNELADRQVQLVHLFSKDRALLLTLKGQSQQVKRSRQAVANQKAAIARLKSSLVAQKVTYQVQASRQATFVSKIAKERVSYERAQSRLEQDAQRLTGIIRRLLASRPKGSTGPALGTGRFAMPARGRLSSNFGWRTHPVYGGKRFHAGADIAAASGSAITAADSGVVIFAGRYGGYGNAVILDHGAGLATVYGHCSRLYVRTGQQIQKGQKIAAVGSTGVSTGPHLHFEVRRNGQAVNPLGYLR